MSEWYYIKDKVPNSAGYNMAVDEYLFEVCHKRSVGFFRLYSWEKPTFSIGVSQKVEKALNQNFLKKDNIGFVRRITGGKTVLHDDEITYSVTSSEKIFFNENDLYKSYSLISGIILNAFQISGINAYFAKGDSGSLSKSSNPCFSFPTPNEIEVRGKKIVGSAQKRDKFALLQHGSIPISMNYYIYSQGTGFKENAIKNSMTTVKDESDISKEKFVKNILSSFQEFINKEVSEYKFSEIEKRRIKQIEKKYASKEWNNRI